MNMIRKIAVLQLTLIMLMGAGGCMNIFPQSDEAVRDEILSELHGKYGREFEAISLERGYSDVLYCYPQGGDPEADRVCVVRQGKENDYTYKDTYFGIVIRDALEQEMQDICAGIGLPALVVYHSDSLYFDDEFDGTKNYADFKQWQGEGNAWRHTVTVVLSLEEADAGEMYAGQIFEKFGDSGFQGLMYVSILPGEGFVKANRANLNDLISEYGEQAPVFSKSIN